MKRRLMTLWAGLFIGIGLLQAQTPKVTGVVLSEEDGQPVVGATVLVKGTTIGVATDVNGKFAFSELPASARTLVVSFVGMVTQEVAVKPQLKIVLKVDRKTLDEVMVVAFGKQKKSSFTGAASVVGEKELAKHSTTNVANVLVGTTPGLQIRGASGAPGAGQGAIAIRGIASMSASTAPLIIVDGSPYSASLSNIPPEDIESVVTLKDAASAALYGARGAAGVILISTKSGKSGKTDIKVDAKWGVSARSVQDYETIDDPGTYYEQVYKQFEQYFRITNPTALPEKINAASNNNMITSLGYNIYTVPDGELLIGMDGKLNPHATLGRTYRSGDEEYYMINEDWRDLAYKNSFRQEYNVSVNGRNDKGGFYASVGYLDEDGVIEYSGYKRLTTRVKADYQAAKWLKVGANVSYVNSRTESNPNMSTSEFSSTNLMYYTSHIAPIYPVHVWHIGKNGLPEIRTDANDNPQYDYGRPNQDYNVGRAFLQTGNPFGSNRYNKVESRVNKMTGAMSVDFQFTKWLKGNMMSSVDIAHSGLSDYENALYGPKAGVNGTITKQQSLNIRQNHIQTLTFNKKFGVHDVEVMAGHEYYRSQGSTLWADAQGLFSPEILEIAAAAKPVTSSSNSSKYNVEGFFSRAQYNFNEKYFFSASFRRDASSNFAHDSRWGSFWSVGGAWLINKERFFHAAWVDQLKLKLSIGQQGNDGIGAFNFIDMYRLSRASDTKMIASFSSKGNPDITWETTTNTNIGIEFQLFNNRLSGNIDYYNKKVQDLLFWVSTPESVGYRGYYDNIGDIRNMGVELSLRGELIRKKNFDWEVTFNIAHNKDKILSLPESKTMDFGGYIEGSTWFKVGGSLYNKIFAEYAGVNEQGEATYYMDSELQGATNVPGHNRDAVTTNFNEATKYEQGRCLPKAFGGFGTSVRIWNFDVNLMFDYQIGGKAYDSNYAMLMGNIATLNSAGSAMHKDVLKAWTLDNPNSDIPRMVYGDQYTTASSTRFLTKTSYLNFQSFSVGYNLPKSFVQKMGLGSARLYANGENLWFKSARKGFDPRYSYGGNSSMNVYSPVRTIVAGIQIHF